jgi:D-alanyl-D-alanine carboxypeptidase
MEMLRPIYQLLRFNSYFIALLLLGCNASNSSKNQGPIVIDTGVQATLEQTIDAYLEANIADDGPGVSIFVVKDNQLAYSKSRGMANIPTGQKINENTGFLMGSVSKFFTSLAVMQLYEKGLIFPQDPLSNYLSETPPAWENMTIHHLLTHQSGIPDWSNDMNIVDDWPDNLTNDHIIEFFLQNPALEFQPGSKAEYSNTGYVFLAEIIERVTGMRYAQYMTENIFQPLGMSNTYVFDENAVPLENTGLNFARTSTQFGGRHYFNYGERGIISTNVDMQYFTNGVEQGEIVSMETLELILQPYATLGNSKYGYGVFVDDSLSNKGAFLHAGSFDGHLALFSFSADRKSRIVILGNGQINTVAPFTLIGLISQFYRQLESNAEKSNIDSQSNDL